MKSWIACLLFLLAGCEHAVAVIDATDASMEADSGGALDGGVDANIDLGGSRGVTTCRVAEGAAWSDVEPATNVSQKFSGAVNRVAIHGDATFAYGVAGLYYSATTGARFEPFSVAGLPADQEPYAVGWVDGTWWINVSTSDDTGRLSLIFAWDAESLSWTRIAELDQFVVDFVQTETLTLLYTRNFSVYRRADATHFVSALTVPDGWWPGVFDVAATRDYVYVSAQNELSQAAILRTADGETWEPMSIDLGDDTFLSATDIAASATTVVLNPMWSNTDFFMLDESTEATSFTRQATDHLVQPVWFGDDGTVLGRLTVGSTTEYYAANALGAAWTRLPGRTFGSYSLGAGFDYYYVQSDGARIVNNRAINFAEQTVEESSDHALTWHSTSTERVPGQVHDLASDGDTMLVRQSRDDGTHGLFVDDGDGAWRTSTIPGVEIGRASLGISVVGVGDRYFARPSTFGETTPALSSDHGVTWTQLANAWPSYFSNTGNAWRTVTSVAETADGAILAGTVGGETSLEGSGSKVGWAYRTGSGLWQIDGASIWQPSNAGVPIEAAGEYGGPPFRADVQSVAVLRDDAFAYLTGHGLYKRVAGRWQAFSAGLPVEVHSVQLASTNTDLFAFTDVGLYTLNGDMWTRVDVATPTTVLASRANLLVRADATNLQVSAAHGDTFAALPALADVTRIAISRTAIYAATRDNALHALPIACEVTE